MLQKWSRASRRRTGAGARLLVCTIAIPFGRAGAAGPVDLAVSSADFSGDGAVDVRDFNILTANFGATEAEFWCGNRRAWKSHLGQHHGDANRDGRVDIIDFNLFARAFGRTGDPPIPPIAGVRVTATSPGAMKVVAQDRTASDLTHTYTVIDSNRMVMNAGKMWWKVGDPDALEPTMVVTPRPDGFDVRVTYVNTSTRVRNYGILCIGGMMFADGVAHERIFGSDDSERKLTTSGFASFYARADKYAPVHSIRGRVASDQDPAFTREYIIGVSVQYPILEYQHGAAFWVKRGPATAPSRPYWLEIGLNRTFWKSPNCDNKPLGDIAPGQTRTYTISVRIMATDTPPGAGPAHPNDYLYLFQEYRRYFKRLYGQVRYANDTRPVNGYKASGMEGASAANWGFCRPQLHDPAGPGWVGWIERLENAERRGFGRSMLWGASGVALNASCGLVGAGMNYPFQFTSNWDVVAGPNRGHPIISTQGDMRSWALTGDRELGFWWGNSSRPAAWGSCESPALTSISMCESADVDAAMREIGSLASVTGTHAVGVTAVGLDAMSSSLRAEDGYVWIQKLVVSNPGTKFVAEPDSIDVMHTIAPSFVGGFQPNGGVGDVNCLINSTHAMADFLNQGHEKWGHILWLPPLPGCDSGEWASGVETERVKQLMKSLADRGFVPVVGGSAAWEDGPYGPGETRWNLEAFGPDLLDPLDGFTEADFEADETWNATVPAGLREE